MRDDPFSDDPAAFQQRLLARRIPFTYTTLVVIVGLFIAKEYIGDHGIVTDVRMGALTPGLTATQPWRLVSHAFLHAGWAHAFFNSMGLISIGGYFERLLGTGRIAVLFVVSAVGGAALAAVLSPNSVMVGASGALSGMLGMSGALALSPGETLPPSVQDGFRRNALTNLGLLVMVTFVPHVSWQAHLGGALVGFALMVTGVLRPKGDVEPRGWRFAGAVMTLLALFCVAIAWMSGRPWELRGAPELTL